MTPETLLPPLALALGRLRQPRPATPRVWPYATRAAAPTHDFLVIAPAGAFTSDEAVNLARTPATTVPGAEAARTYWFDL